MRSPGNERRSPTFLATRQWSCLCDLCLGGAGNLLTNYEERTQQSRDPALGHPWNMKVPANKASLPTLPETPL